MNRNAFLCVEHRIVSRGRGTSPDGSTHCPRDGEPMRDMGRHWRPPRRTNEAAWRAIEAGDFLWDKRALRSARHYTPFRLVRGSRIRDARRLTRAERRS